MERFDVTLTISVQVEALDATEAEMKAQRFLENLMAAIKMANKIIAEAENEKDSHVHFRIV